LDKIRTRLVKLEKRLLKLRKLEEVALFRNSIQRALVNWTQRGLFFPLDILELITVAAKPTLVIPFVDPTAFIEDRPQLLDSLFVMSIGGADPTIIFYSQTRECCLEFVNDLIGVLEKRYSLSLSCALDVYPVLISAGQEE